MGVGLSPTPHLHPDPVSPCPGLRGSLGHTLNRNSLQGQSPSHIPAPQGDTEAPIGNCPGTECSQVLAAPSMTPRPGTPSPHNQVRGHTVSSLLLSHCWHTHATGATRHPCSAAHGGWKVPGRYLGDEGIIRQELEDRGVVITVLHDDDHFLGDLPGVREGTRWVCEMVASRAGCSSGTPCPPWPASQHHPPTSNCLATEPCPQPWLGPCSLPTAATQPLPQHSPRYLHHQTLWR